MVLKNKKMEVLVKGESLPHAEDFKYQGVLFIMDGMELELD